MADDQHLPVAGAVEREPQAQPPYWALFRAWFSIGAQSFGGGAATLYLMRRVAVEQHSWLTDDEFTQYWGICQIAPGINILGQTILIGRKVAGVPGVLLAVLGLLLPSVPLTILIAAAYTSIRDLPQMQTALRGLVPGTVGLGLLMAHQMMRPPLAASRRESRASLALSIVVILGSAALVGIAHASVIGVLWGAGAFCALVAWWRAR
ncbi:MAG TPA: chromate transporter [Roseiflexaceae bacterium]|nr:chromate transporter [Roseiflexaceae bacterium]